MLYSRELVELMRPFPGRRFQMAQLVGFVLKSNRNDTKAKEAARKAVRRVLDRLHVEGFVLIDSAPMRGASARFHWREDQTPTELSMSSSPPPAQVVEV